MADTLISKQALHQAMGVSFMVVTRAIQKGRLKARRIAGRILIEYGEAEKWLNSRPFYWVDDKNILHNRARRPGEVRKILANAVKISEAA